MTPEFLSASSLIGDPVVNPQQEKLGVLKDLMMDLRAGSVAYAVLSRGGFGGVGNKLFAIPWHLISVDSNEKRLVLDVSGEVLDDSPGFNPDEWPTAAQVGWLGGNGNDRVGDRL